jgi:hypothetical protein
VNALVAVLGAAAFLVPVAATADVGSAPRAGVVAPTPVAAPDAAEKVLRDRAEDLAAGATQAFDALGVRAKEERDAAIEASEAEDEDENEETSEPDEVVPAPAGMLDHLAALLKRSEATYRNEIVSRLALPQPVPPGPAPTGAALPGPIAGPRGLEAEDPAPALRAIDALRIAERGRSQALPRPAEPTSAEDEAKRREARRAEVARKAAVIAAEEERRTARAAISPAEPEPPRQPAAATEAAKSATPDAPAPASAPARRDASEAADPPRAPGPGASSRRRAEPPPSQRLRTLPRVEASPLLEAKRPRVRARRPDRTEVRLARETPADARVGSRRFATAGRRPAFRGSSEGGGGGDLPGGMIVARPDPIARPLE